MKYLFLILLICVGFVTKAQFPSQQNPTQFSTGWFKQGWPQADSGHILAVRPPNFTPRFPGTTLLYQNNGVDTSINYWTGARWIKVSPNGTDTTSLSNRINLKLNISDTTNRWWGIGKRWVDTLYRVNDSTVGFTINEGAQQTFQILGRLPSGGGGSGTVTSVGLSLPSAFNVTPSTITTNGTFAVTGAGTTAQYIRGNGTLATTDTGMIPDFHLKVRSLITGTSPITFNQTTGIIGINNANNSGTKGAATFTGAFSDNGSGTIDLLTLGAAGSCTGCNLNIDAKGRITGYADGAGGATNNTNIGAGYRWLNGITQELRTVANSPTITWDSVSTANTLTAKVDTSVLATQYDLTQITGGGGVEYIYSATAPTSGDTLKIWIKTPANMGVYDVFTYATYQFSWIRYGWMSIDGLLSFLPPLNMVIAGQSNAGGIYSGGDTARITGIIGYSSGAVNGGVDDPTAWQPVWIGISPFYLDNNNIAHAFAKEVIRKERRIVRIIGAYLGGTGIGVWNGRTTGGTTPPYMLDTLRQRLDRSGIDTVHVFLWAHGESAYPTPNSDGGYYNDFKCLQDSLFSSLTTGFYRDFTNIVSCDMATDTSTTDIRSGASPQGAMQRLLNDNDPYTSFAAAWGVSLCDGSHFCGTALDTLGRRGYAAWKQMPRNMVDEEPKFTGDYINNKKAFLTRISEYANGLLGTNIGGINLALINNTNTIMGINGITSTVNIGSALGYTSTVTKNFTVNGNTTISDNAYNLIIAGNWNIPNNPLHNIVLANYTSNFNAGAGQDESVLIGFDPGYTSSSNAPFNSVIIGSEAGKGNAGSQFNTYIGRQTGENVGGQQNTFVGGRAGRNSNGSFNTALGMDAGALNGTGRANSFAIGYNAKYNEDSVGVLGAALKSLTIGGLTTPYKFKTDATPSDGQGFTWIAANSQFELTSASSAITIYNGDGTLPTDRNFGSGGFTLRLSGANNSDTVMSIINSGTSGTGLFASGSLFGIDAQSTNVGLRAYGTSQGLLATGENSYGATIKSNSIAGLLVQSVPSTTNTVQEVLRIERGVNGSPGANGVGGSADFFNKASDNSSNVSNQLISKWTDATVGTRTSQFSITGINSASTNTILTIDGDGSLTTIGKRIIALTTSSAGTLTLGNKESYIFNGTTTTWTLPAVSGTTGTIYYIKNIGSGSITLNADSGNNEIYSSSAVNTITITAGSAIILISNNTYWTVN